MIFIFKLLPKVVIYFRGNHKDSRKTYLKNIKLDPSLVICSFETDNKETGLEDMDFVHMTQDGI
jgi:hypothetical protein